MDRAACAAIAAPAAATHFLRHGPVARAVRLLGDRWSILILRDAFQGVRRFEQFRARGGAPRATLARRLRSLAAAGLLRHGPDGEYRLTARGRDLYGLSLVAWAWEKRWAPAGDGIPGGLVHRDCGREAAPELGCRTCGEPLTLHAAGVRPLRPGPGRGPARPARSLRLSARTAATHRGSDGGLTHLADVVGDPWSPLVIAAAFLGRRRFEAFEAELDIASNILAARLELLVRQGILERRRYQDQPPRHEYRLTDRGRGLFAYAAVLNDWGNRWLAGPQGPACELLHHGHRAVPVVRCRHCRGELAPDAVIMATAPGAPRRPNGDSPVASAK